MAGMRLSFGRPRPLPLCVWLLASLLFASACSRSSEKRPASETERRDTPLDVSRAGEATPGAMPSAPAGPLTVAVIIDNFPGAARPQVGLDRAEVVYELLVEGGVTRFVAVYRAQEADQVLPVRSARTPTVLLAAEWDALLAHVGAAEPDGEANAVRRMAEWGVRGLDGDADLDGAADLAAFRREPDRPMPHNMAASTQALRARAAELGWSPRRPTADWPRTAAGSGPGRGDGPAHHVHYNFALQFPAHPAFAVTWTYDEELHAYLRTMAGAPHLDGASGTHLSAQNVVVQVYRAAVVSREGHVVYEQIGEGTAFIFRDGTAIRATWTKRTPDDLTRYWHADGTEVHLADGATWVALLPEGSPFSWQ